MQFGYIRALHNKHNSNRKAEIAARIVIYSFVFLEVFIEIPDRFVKKIHARAVRSVGFEY